MALPVQGQNPGLAPGAWDGGAVGRAGVYGMTVNHAVGLHKNAKKPGTGVQVPCSRCGVDNTVAMVMGTRAQFTCGVCGAVVLWRPRQVWLRDQGAPMEMAIHPRPGEKDGVDCKCMIM